MYFVRLIYLCICEILKCIKTICYVSSVFMSWCNFVQNPLNYSLLLQLKWLMMLLSLSGPYLSLWRKSFWLNNESVESIYENRFYMKLAVPSWAYQCERVSACGYCIFSRLNMAIGVGDLPSNFVTDCEKKVLPFAHISLKEISNMQLYQFEFCRVVNRRVSDKMIVLTGYFHSCQH